MTSELCATLRSNAFFVAYVKRTAHRYFHNLENAEDAEAEAWEKLQAAPDALPINDYLDIARRAISSMYMRQWRKRKQLFRRKT